MVNGPEINSRIHEYLFKPSIQITEIKGYIVEQRELISWLVLYHEL